MGSLGFYFNQENCIGCGTCQIACKDRNDLPVGILYRTVAHYEAGAYPNPSAYNYSAACNHCDNPACVENCPTGAMAKCDDGTVQHDDNVCIGCETCVKSCPYGVPVLKADQGIVGKCDSCKAFRDAGLNPVCVDACMTRCLEFGDIDELIAKHGDGLVREIAILPSAETTGPNTLIKPRRGATEANFKQVVM